MKTLSAREKKVANATLGGMALAGVTAWALNFNLSVVIGLAVCGFIMGGFLAEALLKKAPPDHVRKDEADLEPLESVTKHASDVSSASLLASDGMSVLDRQVAQAAQMAEDPATIGSLYGFRKSWKRLEETTLDHDLAKEVEVITNKNLQRLISSYRSSRKLADEDGTTHADQVLRASVDRLAARLDEIASLQAGRSLDGLQETDTYLRNRHPIRSDDPFAG